ncbi:MAG: septal ring lytic transglycosylase RlpA family protein [Candidatus Neomarinimicrobiota bacterium]|nr:MAG: septal ring lytic transglycosylase RlpA family protein [Candidatus Neomarinimicrobiota bacterium]
MRRLPAYLGALGILGVLVSCATAPRYTHSESTPPARKESSPIRSKKVMTGISSYYGKDFHGKLTANGEVFDMYGLTAAHKTLPLNTVVRVTNLDNGKSVILRINDRGPYVKGRILDCSYGAAKKLGFVQQGTARVRIEVLEWGDNEYMQHDEN